MRDLFMKLSLKCDIATIACLVIAENTFAEFVKFAENIFAKFVKFAENIFAKFVKFAENIFAKFV